MADNSTNGQGASQLESVKKNRKMHPSSHTEEAAITISPLSAILTIVATFALFLFGGVALIILLGYESALVFGELLLVVIPLSYLNLKGVNIRIYIKLDLKLKVVITGVLLGVLVFLFNVIVSTVLISIFGVSKAVEDASGLISEMSSSPQGLLLLIVALSLAGICEEFTFRGFLQTAMNSRYPLWISLLVSSTAFGIFHFDPQLVYTVSAFLSGLLLGYLYNRWNSYVVPAVSHATMNLIVLAISVLLV